jgi:hypothetical protein
MAYRRKACDMHVNPTKGSVPPHCVGVHGPNNYPCIHRVQAVSNVDTRAIHDRVQLPRPTKILGWLATRQMECTSVEHTNVQWAWESEQWKQQ